MDIVDASTPESRRRQAREEILKTFNAGIERSNAEFEKMGPEQKRVQIARDVLAALKARRVLPKRGTYVEDVTGPQDRQVQHVVKGMADCTVCALGAAFVCAVSRADKLKFGDLSSDSKHWYDNGASVRGEDIYTYLGRFFTKGQLTAMEAAFEGWHVSADRYDNDDPQYEGDYSRFNRGVRGARKRMARVMRLIVRRRGRFTHRAFLKG